MIYMVHHRGVPKGVFRNPFWKWGWLAYHVKDYEITVYTIEVGIAPKMCAPKIATQKKHRG